MPHVTLPRIGTATAWRDAARGLLSGGITPEQVTWGDTTTPAGLFDDPCPAPSAGTVTVPRSFVSMADRVVWHSDPARFARLYAFL
ncbi:MAG: uracil-DNA glycosylase, partial [Roseobacter sp.]